MKTYLISIPDKSESLFLNLFRKFGIKNRALSNEDYEKKLMHGLIKESEASEDVSDEDVKKYFHKHGIEV